MVVAATGQLENRRAPTTTLEGWRSFVNADPSDLALLPRDQWEALDERDRRDYDEARIAHHAELVVVSTSAIQEITSEGQMLVLMNQREIGARRGLIVSGDAATGKTTSIKQLGRLHELRVRARFPAARDRIPVVYVTCPPKGSPRASWPWSSPASSACRRSDAATTPPISPTRSAKSCWRPG